MAKKQDGPVALTRIGREAMSLKVVGLTPLITHNWSEKAKKQIRDKQAGQARKKLPPRDPQAEYEAAFYRLPDGTPGIPATAFKAATVAGARMFEDLTLVSVKTAIFVVGEGPEQLVRIDSDEPEFTEMMVRIGTGISDPRYRPRFHNWSCNLEIIYNSTLLTKESVVALVDAGGHGGVGEHRPSSPKSLSGTYGMYEVAF